jgi:hypothetical protein
MRASRLKVTVLSVNFINSCPCVLKFFGAIVRFLGLLWRFKMRALLPLIVAVSLGVSIQGASAAVIFSDDFDANPGSVLNWPGDSVFKSIPQPGNVDGKPSVDLVAASNPWGITTFSGNSVDLDGSTGNGNTPAGQLQSVISLALGSYLVEFELAGNQRIPGNQTPRVSVGGQFVDIM